MAVVIGWVFDVWMLDVILWLVDIMMMIRLCGLVWISWWIFLLVFILGLENIIWILCCRLVGWVSMFVLLKM